MKHAANSCRQYCKFALMWLPSLYLQALVTFVTFVTFVTHWTRWTLGVFGNHIHGQLSINFVPLEDHCQSNWIAFFYLEQVSQVSEGAFESSSKQRFPSHRSIHANVTLHSTQSTGLWYGELPFGLDELFQTSSDLRHLRPMHIKSLRCF